MLKALLKANATGLLAYELGYERAEFSRGKTNKG